MQMTLPLVFFVVVVFGFFFQVNEVHTDSKGLNKKIHTTLPVTITNVQPSPAMDALTEI